MEAASVGIQQTSVAVAALGNADDSSAYSVSEALHLRSETGGDVRKGGGDIGADTCGASCCKREASTWAEYKRVEALGLGLAAEENLVLVEEALLPEQLELELEICVFQFFCLFRSLIDLTSLFILALL